MTEIVNWAKETLRLPNIACVVGIFAIGAVLLFLRPRWGRRWIVVGVLGYWLLSTPIGSTLLVTPLVRSVHSIEDPREAGSARAIVVLGGGIRELRVRSDALAYPEDATTLRVLEAARVFRLLDGRPIVIASGGMTQPGQQAAEGTVIAEALARLQVPRDHIVVEEASRTTHEQAILVTRLLQTRGIDRFILVTSPTHMSRSVAVFRAQHADVIPSGSALVRENRKQRRLFMPNGDSLEISDDGVYAYASLAYYWARGWFRPTATP